jgi:hypothetical protein
LNIQKQQHFLAKFTPNWYKLFNEDINTEGNSNNWELLTTKTNLNSSNKALYNPFPSLPTFPTIIPTRFRKLTELENFEEISRNQNSSVPFQHPLLCVENDCAEKNRIFAFESLLFPTTTWGIISNPSYEQTENNFQANELSETNFYHVNIFDITGRRMKQTTASSFEISKRDLAELSPGIYVVQFYSNTNQLIFQSCVIIKCF